MKDDNKKEDKTKMPGDMSIDKGPLKEKHINQYGEKGNGRKVRGSGK